MKFATKVLLVLGVMALALPSQSATILKLTFDSAPVVDDATYDFAIGDIPASGVVTRYFRGLPGPPRDYGLLQPDPGVDTGDYPDIVVPPASPFVRQGGNAFYTCLGTVASPQNHIGWYIDRNNGLTTTGDFTVEVIFMIAKIGSSTNMVEGCEYSLQSVIGTEMIAGSGAGWAIRVFPDPSIFGTPPKIQLNMSETGGVGGGEVNIDALDPNTQINRWYHAAIVYRAGTDQAEFFINHVSQGTASPNWGAATPNQDDWWIGAWPSNGANRGMAGWIDAVAISDTALTPSNFVLPAALPVEEWVEY